MIESKVDLINFNKCAKFMKDTFDIKATIDVNPSGLIVYTLHIPSKCKMSYGDALIIINNLYNSFLN